MIFYSRKWVFLAFISIAGIFSSCAHLSSAKDSPCLTNERTPAGLVRQCEDLFNPLYDDSPQISKDASYAYLARHEGRLTKVIDGMMSFLSQKTFRLFVSNATVDTAISERRSRPVHQSFQDNPLEDSILKENQKTWDDAVEEAIDFVLKEYAERRNWPLEFHEKLRALAKTYQDYSTYITVKHTSQHTGKVTVFGSLRLIEEHQGLLPVEEYLQIKIKSHGAVVKLEPGNFAIDKSVNQYIFGEVMLHLVQTILEKSQNQETHYFTYADSASLVMYGLLGFKPMTAEEFELVGDTKLDAQGRIEKDGILWTPMKATRADLEAILTKYLEGTLRTQKSAEAREIIESRKKQIPLLKEEKIFRGMAHFQNQEPSTCIFELSPSVANVSGNPEHENDVAVLFGDPSRGERAFRNWWPFSIPNKTLEDGYHYERDLGEEYYSVIYFEGYLSFAYGFKGQKPHLFYTIKISPDLKTIESVEIRSPDYNVEAHF